MRKLATALAVSIALSSGLAHALSLGEIEMRSALNQPMSAEIQLSSVRPGELDNMIVKLASPEAFTRAGIDRTDVLSDLQFSVNEVNQTIVITSRRPVVEPFLNFLLEIEWPSGRMVREYTVLLDPPVFLSPSTSARSETGADTPAIVQRGDASLVTPAPIQRGSTANEGEAVALDSLSVDEVPLGGEDATFQEAPGAGASNGGEVVSLTDLGAPNPDARAEFDENQLPDVELIGGGNEASTGTFAESSVNTQSPESVSLDGLGSSPDVADTSVTVQRGDTLGVIAQQVAPSGVSPQQMMLALLAANESAFINGNINLVKAGAVLRVPGASEAAGISQAQAVASVNDQNRLWQEFRDSARSGQRASQVASSPQTEQSAPAATVDDQTATDQAQNTVSQAEAILENAREEVRTGDELKIVADNDSATSTASATSDESTENDANGLSEINRRLQLAREELASSRREAADLADQSVALQDTGSKQDTLVSLQQNDIAALEEQLQAARIESGVAVETPVDDSAAESAAEAQNAANSALDAVDAATDALDEVEVVTDVESALGGEQIIAPEQPGSVEGVGAETAAEGQAAAQDAARLAAEAQAAARARAQAQAQAADAEALDAVAEAEAKVEAEAAAGTEVEAQAVAEVGSDATEAPESWLDGVMQSNLKWIPIGLGAVFGLGLLGTLFAGRRKRNVVEDDLDSVQFFDDADSADIQAVSGSNVGVGDQVGKVSDESGSGASTAAAAGVGVATAATATAAAGFEGQDDSDNALASASGVDDLDHDDTISEVDVYLAYGLHGQAEELLTKAIDRDNENPEYHTKLLETYAAQGNADSYSEAASQFHEKFGSSHAEWANIASRGAELDPGNSLYSNSGDAVASVGIGRYDEAPSLDNDDFLSDSDSSEAVASTNRGFSDAAEEVGVGGAAGEVELPSASLEDETHLLDQTIDPAFAFDEGDLDATGDFSQMADDITAGGGDGIGGLDFPSFDSQTDGITDAASGISGTVGDKASAAMNDTSVGLAAAGTGAAVAGLAATNLELDTKGNTALAEDLTVDLDHLSGDMELDSTEMLDDSLNSATGLELDSTGISDDTLLAGTDSLESVDEMDTMMDLAKAYIDMGDNDSASSALDEIVKSGNPQQVSEAETLKQKIS